MPLPLFNPWILVHGWGQTPAFWSEVIGRLDPAVPVVCPDRGYFGPPRAVTGEGGRNVCVVTHSFGLHLLDQDLLCAVKRLVIVGGFYSFLPEEPRARRRSERVLRLMQTQLVRDPAALITRFRALCGMDGVWHAPVCDTDLLAEDLTLLATRTLEKNAVCSVPEIHILHGTKDRVVAPDRAEELHSLLSGSRLTWVEGADHAIPVTHPEAVVSAMTEPFVVVV